MIYLSGLIEDEKGLMVTYEHHKPELLGKTNDELLTNGILLEQLPIKEAIENKIAVLYLNKTTKEPFYVYEDAPLTPEQELAQLKADQALMQKALDDLLLGGAL